METHKTHHKPKVKLSLLAYDLLIMLFVGLFLLVIGEGGRHLTAAGLACQILVAAACIFISRLIGGVYKQIWRYGGIQSYILLLITDFVGGVFYVIIDKLFLPMPMSIRFVSVAAIVSMNLLAALSIRMVYRYAYKCGNGNSWKARLMRYLLLMFAGRKLEEPLDRDEEKTRVAIVGAGRVGVALAEELNGNIAAEYKPVMFIEKDIKKIDREIHSLPIVSEQRLTQDIFKKQSIKEIVIAVPSATAEEKRNMYQFYKQFGCKVKIYDYPTMQAAGGKRHLREFDIEDLLFRKQVVVIDEKTGAYYKDKTVMITGGGGSIGSELCRQIAKMQPGKLVILDVYENGAYDVQQELKMAYGNKLNIQVVIVSVCNKIGLERAFAAIRPQVVIHAAAHKHVPLMEDDCIEAVENNVFGTLNCVELAEKYGAERFIMVSTDKAVNPTNVMGATKRMCEMIVLNHEGNMKCSATRFGNVLGSAGSVVPLFKKQIAAGGPVTITDKRIIRYFMTIPEASQLVLQSGAMAKNGELFVLDMGQPVKILDLAENMIKLSGQTGIEIKETGLRPGEKLYEELLVKTEELDKTENELIYIERDKRLSREEITEKLVQLLAAVESGDGAKLKETLHKVVPTYKTPAEVNNII